MTVHPPNNDHLTVTNFIVPETGSYSVLDLGVQKTSVIGDTLIFKVFNNNKSLIASLQASTDNVWVLDDSAYNLGNLSAGDNIYFAVDRDGTYDADFCVITWTVVKNQTTDAAHEMYEGP